MWKYHLCYGSGYIINRAFHTKKILKWNGLVFHWCLYSKKNVTWPRGDAKKIYPQAYTYKKFSVKFRPFFILKSKLCQAKVLLWGFPIWMAHQRIFRRLKKVQLQTGVFFAWACATAEQPICMEAHHRVCIHQNGAFQSYHRDYFARWSWPMCSWFNKMCSLQKNTLTWS